MKISLAMITKNEEHNLPIILALLKPFVDEICIADSFSADRTVFVAQQFGAKVVQYSYATKEHECDAAAQRNRSIELATGDWIFVLDGDEFPSVYLAFHLKGIAKQAEELGYDCVSFSRQNYTSGVLHNDKPGEDLDDRHIRLFKKNLRYVGWHSEGLTGWSKKWDHPFHIIHSKTLKRGVDKHEEHRSVFHVPVFPFPKWFQDIFGVEG